MEGNGLWVLIFILCFTCSSSMVPDQESQQQRTTTNSTLINSINVARTGNVKGRKATRKDMKLTVHEVHEKLSQLHYAIDGLQAKVKSMDEGPDHQAAIESHYKIGSKFSKLSEIISKLSEQNMKLYTENISLRQSNIGLVGKIQKVEDNLNKLVLQQRRNSNIKKESFHMETWLKQTSHELKLFLEDNGLEHFSSPKFSPIVAGIVSNGIILIPLGLTSLYLLHYVKKLTMFHIVMSFNIFDLGICISLLSSSILILGDPLEGLRHISEINFVFVQMVMAFIYWVNLICLCFAIFQYRGYGIAWKCYIAQIGFKVFTGLEYGRKVWSPVMDRDDIPIALPFVWYVLYCFIVLLSLLFTVWAQTCSLGKCYQKQPSLFDATSEEDAGIGSQKLMLMNCGDCILPGHANHHGLHERAD